MKNTGGQVAGQVRVREQRELSAVMHKARLSRQEELVLRMRNGLSEPRTATLEFRGQDNPELATKLAMMELATLRELRARAAGPQETPHEAALTRSIIERLKKI